MLLHYTSYHPFHVKSSVIYTQALRYCTIISEDHNLHKELITLKKTFIARGYPINLINKYFNKALDQDQTELLQRKNNPSPTPILTFISPHHPSTDAASHFIRDTWRTLESDPILSQLWPNPPVTARKKHANIGDLLVHTRQHLPPPRSHNIINRSLYAPLLLTYRISTTSSPNHSTI